MVERLEIMSQPAADVDYIILGWVLKEPSVYFLLGNVPSQRLTRSGLEAWVLLVAESLLQCGVFQSIRLRGAGLRTRASFLE